VDVAADSRARILEIDAGSLPRAITFTWGLPSWSVLQTPSLPVNCKPVMDPLPGSAARARNADAALATDAG
jgi:hypothetical protein